jgi:HD-GYP domain-containing protein (c-di-GMP phosphodiesterase class II)
MHLSKILEIGISLAAQKDYNKLLELFFSEVMKITNSDAGTLYLYEDNSLKYKLTRNNSLKIINGNNGELVKHTPLDMDSNNVCVYSALNKKIVNIPDVYSNSLFDFTDTRKMDLVNGYHTKSMLVIPLELHEGGIMGVLQLINSTNTNGEFIPFSADTEYIAFSIASQATVSISNIKYLQETKELLYSIVSVMATAIDEKTPYNANHTRNVSKNIDEFLTFLNKQYNNGEFEEYFDDNRKEQLILAAQLHDIGKIVIPLKIMNKSTRLGSKYEVIASRFELLRAYIKIDFLEGNLSKKQYEESIQYLDHSIKEIIEINTISILEDSHIHVVESLSTKSYRKKDGTCIKYLEEEEKDCLLIQKGTLTISERKIMENHVVVTSKLLEEIHFNKSYVNVPTWARSHHEYLDGSGYPDKLEAKDLPTDVRILVIMDIFESLTSKDRPYKDPIPVQEAFDILNEMVVDGKLDGKLIKQLNLLYYK